MSMQLFDSHCHVNEERFDADREDVLRRMAERGVCRYAVIGSDMATSRAAMDYAAVHDGCWCAVGIHPHEASGYREGDLSLLAAWSKEAKVRAVGEIGLDYHYDYSPRDVQKRVCELQIELAWELGLPAAFHVREAHPDMIDILKAHKAHLTGGIIHCFSGSWEIAKEYLKLGYFISFAGPVTFRKAPKLAEAALQVPQDRLLIETDSPYMAPEPVRGTRNEPANVFYVCEKIAAIRGETPEAVAAYTTENAMRVYGIGAEEAVLA